MNSKGNQIPSALIVVAPRDFRDEEYLDVHAQLVEAGFWFRLLQPKLDA